MKKIIPILIVGVLVLSGLGAVAVSEKENNELQRLDKRFYVELSDHIRVHKEELQMLEEKTLRAKLTGEKSERTKKLFKDLIWTRYRKIFEAVLYGKPIAVDFLTLEEEGIHRDILSAHQRMRSLEKDIFGGHVPKVKEAKNVEKPKRTLLVRLLQAIPAIVGSNTKIYGPFKAEDIASLPIENAESLIKRGIAFKVEPE